MKWLPPPSVPSWKAAEVFSAMAGCFASIAS